MEISTLFGYLAGTFVQNVLSALSSELLIQLFKIPLGLQSLSSLGNSFY